MVYQGWPGIGYRLAEVKAKLAPSLVCTSVMVAVVVGSRVHQSAKLDVPVQGTAMLHGQGLRAYHSPWFAIRPSISIKYCSHTRARSC